MGGLTSSRRLNVVEMLFRFRATGLIFLRLRLPDGLLAHCPPSTWPCHTASWPADTPGGYPSRQPAISRKPPTSDPGDYFRSK
jgi:hypothetical protein